MQNNSIRNKIYTIYKQNQDNQYKVSLQSDIQDYLLNNIKNTNVLNNVSSVPYYINEDFSILTPWCYDGETLEEAYKIWSIDIPFIPDSWIAGIKPIILKKYGEDSTGELQDTTDVKENFIIGIDESPDEDSPIKKITINVSYVVRDYYGIQDDIQVKLLLCIPSPIITI